MRIDGGVKGAKMRKRKLLDKQTRVTRSNGVASLKGARLQLSPGAKRSRHVKRRCGTFEHDQSGGLIERRDGECFHPAGGSFDKLRTGFIAALRMGDEG